MILSTLMDRPGGGEPGKMRERVAKEGFLEEVAPI